MLNFKFLFIAKRKNPMFFYCNIRLHVERVGKGGGGEIEERQFDEKVKLGEVLKKVCVEF